MRHDGKAYEHGEPGMVQRTQRQAVLRAQSRGIYRRFLRGEPPRAGRTAVPALPLSLPAGRRLETLLPQAEDRQRRLLPPRVQDRGDPGPHFPGVETEIGRASWRE